MEESACYGCTDDRIVFKVPADKARSGVMINCMYESVEDSKSPLRGP